MRHGGQFIGCDDLASLLSMWERQGGGKVSEEALMDIKQVASYLQINEATAYSWAQKGKLPGIKIGRIWRFRREDIEAWLDRNMSVPKPAGESAATGERGN